jgi:hypothetical protein
MISLLLIGGISLASHAYMRGRARNQNFTVVSDQGTNLRGITVNVTSSVGNAGSVSYWRQAADSGFNSMRLGVQFAQPWQTNLEIAPKLPWIEQAVAASESAGMYIGIDYHDISGTEAQRPYDFWCAVAPKYRDKTHVIYEVSNEANYPYQEQEALYRIIRSKAPLTLILTNSFSVANNNMTVLVDRQKKISYANAAVAYHPYSTSNPTEILRLHSKYPCMTTELTPYPGLNDWNIMQYLNGVTTDSLGWVRWHEQQGISWWLWGVGSANAWRPVLTYARRDGYMWQKDNYTTAPVVPFSATFKGGADTIYYGDSLILGWECPHATSVSIDNGIGTVSAFGSRKVIPTASTMYTLIAQGPDGPATSQVTVTVLPQRTPENPANTVAGLTYRYYEGSYGIVPNFNSLTPVKTGTCATFDLTVANRTTNMGIRYDGYLTIPSDGIYCFTTSGYSGTRLYVGTTLVVDNSTWQGPGPVIGFIGLKAGKHAFHVDFFNATGTPSIAVTLNWAAIPNSSLSTNGAPALAGSKMPVEKQAPFYIPRQKLLLVGDAGVKVRIVDMHGRTMAAPKTAAGAIDLSRLRPGYYSAMVDRCSHDARNMGIMLQ